MNKQLILESKNKQLERQQHVLRDDLERSNRTSDEKHLAAVEALGKKLQRSADANEVAQKRLAGIDTAHQRELLTLDFASKRLQNEILKLQASSDRDLVSISRNSFETSRQRMHQRRLDDLEHELQTAREQLQVVRSAESSLEMSDSREMLKLFNHEKKLKQKAERQKRTQLRSELQKNKAWATS